GIRDRNVTGVQTCALPIYKHRSFVTIEYLDVRREFVPTVARWLHEEWGQLRLNETTNDRVVRVERACGHHQIPTTFVAVATIRRSEERRVGKECRCWVGRE